MLKRILSTTALIVAVSAPATWGACCYFAAIGKDVNQPGQKAFISWDERHDLESFTVQPTFSGTATEFGMVIPTPSRPKLQEMPRDFFKALAIFTILEPMDLSKYKRQMVMYKSSDRMMRDSEGAIPRNAVRVLEHGVVGNLDYKVLEADRADALYQWLQENHYNYGGDKATLQSYVDKKWNFTTMKIDPRQMKKDASGKFTGDITPTRFTFGSSRLIYPLHITQLSVKDSTDALFYVMAREKMDLPGKWSYEPNFLSMWSQAIGYAVPEKLTEKEKKWKSRLEREQRGRSGSPDGGSLEWAGVLTRSQLDFLSGDRKFDRDAPPEEAARLKVLQGHLKEGWYLTKMRKSFSKQEMVSDLELVPARVGKDPEDLDYTMILPTSPP